VQVRQNRQVNIHSSVQIKHVFKVMSHPQQMQSSAFKRRLRLPPLNRGASRFGETRSSFGDMWTLNLSRARSDFENILLCSTLMRCGWRRYTSTWNIYSRMMVPKLTVVGCASITQEICWRRRGASMIGLLIVIEPLSSTHRS
jgi:hypothetical protein